jgi:hypothetical protein
MARLNWLFAIALGALPMASGVAMQQPKDSSRPEVGGPQAKVNNPHGPISTPCQNCHTYTSWKPIRSNPEFNHDQTGYPLRGMHQKVGCMECHTSLVFKKVSTRCADCHADIHRGKFGANCESCHAVKGWQVSLDAIKNHQNRFPLVGAHALLQCDDCHKNAAAGQFEGLSTACYSCHQKDFQTPVLNHVTLGFPTTCESCHTVDSWFNARFDHLKYTGYALTGMHATLPCASCHVNNVFAGTPTDCFTCHMADFTNSNNPPHAQLGLPHTCADCHSTSTWLNAKFDHALYAHYPLTGGHATVACAQCHVNNNYESTPTACYACHQADFTGTTNPNHVTSGFPTDCSLCHTTSGWNTSTFNHNTTAFPLTGAHVTVPCASCHVNGNFTTVPTDCYSCHKADYSGTNAPPHAAVGFPTTCATCHSTTAWTGSTFDHSTMSFPLTGAHVNVTCAACHVNNNYTTLPTACYGCHQADYTGTTNPSHVAAAFPTDCTQCHTTANWTTATFNHNSTSFPLTGAHVNVPCASCHVNNNYTTLPTACYGCHQADFTGTTNPNHVTAAFPTDCTLCHTTTSWTGATFNHNNTAFPLTGAHITVPCASCHVNNNYTTLPTACYGCHQADFTGTTNPAHVAAGFPTDCTLCHTTTNWTTSTFNHASVFPLVGAHATLACAQCHTNNNYTTVPTTCYGCHQADFTGTTNPSHVAAAFPTTCDTCHNTTVWTTVTFNHALYANYPLTGAHATLTCGQCHTNNSYTSTPTACYACHQADFTGTTNPAHVAAGFPTDCTLCHTTTNWTTSTFNHASVFPLTGMHATIACTACHTNNNYTTLPTACYGCHQADWNGTTNPNHAAAGFPTTCDTCHTTTDWTGATFNHNNTPFPLTGAHLTVACNLCHVNNVFAGTPTDCYSCHMADFTGTTNPNPVTAGWPTTCVTCHTTTAWIPATLPSSYHTFFPLNHGNANGVCATCHTNSSDYSVFQCTGCHSAASTNGEHNGVSGYVYNSVNCYACHKNGGGG